MSNQCKNKFATANLSTIIKETITLLKSWVEKFQKNRNHFQKLMYSENFASRLQCYSNMTSPQVFP